MSGNLALHIRLEGAFREYHPSNNVRVLHQQPMLAQVQRRPPQPRPRLVAPHLGATGTAWVVLQYRWLVRQTLTQPTERVVPGQQPYAMRARQLLVRIPDLAPLQEHGVVGQPEEWAQVEPFCHADRERDILAGGD